jgi:CDP-diacylglycerol--glycerol-3-phosphate 3-phosphatidyltransferase
MGISQPQGTELEQFNWIQHNPIFKIQFFFAFMISPSLIYLMLSQLDKFPTEIKISSTLGLIFITGYFVLNSISYASQIVLVPKLIDIGLIEHAKVWYFSSSSSLTYFFNQMGYCFWGAGTMILFIGLMKEKGMIKYISILYTVSAILSIIAFAGLLLDNKPLNSMTLYSGLLLIPIGIMTIIWGIKDNNQLKIVG